MPESLDLSIAIVVSRARPDPESNPGNQCGIRLEIEINPVDDDAEGLVSSADDEEPYDPGPPLTLTVAETFVRRLFTLYVEAGRQFVVTVPNAANLSGTFPADCTTPEDVEHIVTLLSDQARRSTFHNIYPIHAWGLAAANARDGAWLIREFVGDPNDESLWVTLLGRGVLQLSIAETTCDVFTNGDDFEDALDLFTETLRFLPYPTHWTHS